MANRQMALLCLVLLVTPLLTACQKATGDPQCSTSRRKPVVYAQEAKTAEEFLERGDKEFDGGNCKEAIAAYSQALTINREYAEAYNNRAYTFMRMQYYRRALEDLDQALSIRPEYLHALMNRGDIHTYFFK